MSPYEEDYDDVKYQELKKHLDDYCDANEFPHCNCSEDYVEFLQEDFQHMKRDYFIYDIEYICINCEQSWIKRIHLDAKIYEFKLTQMPTKEEEE